jgi:hypothetical protein
MHHLVLFAIASIALAAPAGFAQTTARPPLPTETFVRGRPATKDDIAAGRAVFVAAVDGVAVGHPIDITIPQYAYYPDRGVKIAVIVVQAESAEGQLIVGARKFDGTEIVCLLGSFEQLGVTPPSEAGP